MQGCGASPAVLLVKLCALECQGTGCPLEVYKVETRWVLFLLGVSHGCLGGGQPLRAGSPLPFPDLLSSCLPGRIYLLSQQRKVRALGLGRCLYLLFPF